MGLCTLATISEVKPQWAIPPNKCSQWDNTIRGCVIQGILYRSLVNEKLCSYILSTLGNIYNDIEIGSFCSILFYSKTDQFVHPNNCYRGRSLVAINNRVCCYPYYLGDSILFRCEPLQGQKKFRNK